MVMGVLIAQLIRPGAEANVLLQPLEAVIIFSFGNLPTVPAPMAALLPEIKPRTARRPASLDFKRQTPSTPTVQNLQLGFAVQAEQQPDGVLNGMKLISCPT